MKRGLRTRMKSYCELLKSDRINPNPHPIWFLQQNIQFCDDLCDAEKSSDPEVKACFRVCRKEMESGFNRLEVAFKQAQQVAPDAFLERFALRLGEHAIPLNDNEIAVLHALIESGPLTITPLIEQSGVEHAPRIIKRLLLKHPEITNYVILPKRNRQGYSVKNMRFSAEKQRP